MSYELRAGITAGRIDAGDLGTFDVESHTLEVDDYDTAVALVDRYAVEWPDGGSDPPDDAPEPEDEPPDQDVDDELVATLQDLTIPEFEEGLEDGRFDGRLGAVGAAEEEGKDRDGIYDAIDGYEG